MNYETELAAVKAMTPDEALAYTVQCAKDVLDVFCRSASEQSIELANRLVAALETQRFGLDAKGWKALMMALPEADIDDSHDPRYFAMRALGLLVDSINATEKEHAVETAISACGGKWDLLSDIEFMQQTKK